MKTEVKVAKASTGGKAPPLPRRKVTAQVEDEDTPKKGKSAKPPK